MLIAIILFRQKAVIRPEHDGAGSDHRKGRMHDGFTLLELIIVLALMVVILGLSTAFFSGALPSAKLNGLSRDFSTAIRQARAVALNRGERQTLVVDLDMRTYGLEGYTPRAIPPEIAVWIVDPSQGEIHRGRYVLIFHSTGGIEGGTILLASKKKTVAIEIDPIVGSIVVRQ